METQNLRRCPGAVRSGIRLSEAHECLASDFTSPTVSKCRGCALLHRNSKLPQTFIGPEINPSTKRCVGAKAHKSDEVIHPPHYVLRDFFNKNRSTKDGLGVRCKACHRLASKSKAELVPEYFKDYRREHVEESRSRVRNRRALVIGAHDEDVQRTTLLDLHGMTCYLGCGRDVTTLDETWHVEHVIPLSRGGRHSYENTRVSCQTCNLSKNDKTIREHLGEDWDNYNDVDPLSFNRTMLWHVKNTPERFSPVT